MTETTFECWKDKSLLTTWNAYSRNRSRSFFVDFKTSIVEEFSGSSVAFSHSSYCFVVLIIISDVSLLYMSRLREGFWLKKGKSQPPNKMKSQNREWFLPGSTRLSFYTSRGESVASGAAIEWFRIFDICFCFMKRERWRVSHNQKQIYSHAKKLINRRNG